MSASRKTILIILAFFAIYVIWGSTYLLNKIAVTHLPPFFLASMRFVTASILIFIIAKISKISLKISWPQLKNAAIAGFLFLTFGNGVVVWALKYVDSGFAALEISAQPLVVLILLRILQGKQISLMSYVGVFLGFLGIFLLVGQKELLNQEGQIIGMITILCCMISWSYASIFVGKADLPSNHFVNTGYQMLSGGLFLGIISLMLNEPWSAPKVWPENVQWAMLGLILFGSLVAFTAFNFLLKTVSPEKVATSTYVNPIIALILGWWILDEHISFQSICAAVILLTGVYFINSNRKFKFRSIGR
ncbi:EamA family transporter [Tamlana sp. 2_MG-2023]|uniref:EamA family transporter n=1 Tax=unclassified Tamlana TaxID=2614803 RepID=UPI0026E17E1D|nr:MULTISPECIES: EamA family transporter [unclassified Tamlana]MDO6759470.1 EamA family transporter [Tamlana sp. 2_MG-2023]MDO6790391.1 EamA family transporter [Tamlana sp. 1_MG-2023]